MTNTTPKSNNSTTKLAVQAGTEFVSGIFVGVIFGLGIDHFFSTKPFGLIIMILLGAAAGFRNIFRLVTKDNAKLESNYHKEQSTDQEKKS